jgi:hypothetical protein
MNKTLKAKCPCGSNSCTIISVNGYCLLKIGKMKKQKKNRN